ncbi:MAG TPA: diadenylate cyclase CdaA [Candidatus Omnitrophota bacterium]|nr:diadenylate cyclase CdaA [Candidatus Omnitrophota bacterium]HPS21127.1 diadenylate cyclase CdaA [Candidatus Omnitrophota bacterium]
MAIDFLIRYWDAIFEIMMLWGVYYMVFLLLKDTVAEQVFKGLLIIVIVAMITRSLNLVVINWLLTRLIGISVIAFLIIFQPEIRRGLAQLGRLGMFSGGHEVLEEIAKAAVVLSKKKNGALIAIERKIGLRRYVESGVEVDSTVTSELVNTIFMPLSPLHDGGIIISGPRVQAAACLFPLTQNPKIPKTMGTRHRAAIGLSEETDAVVVIVSEETGDISVAVGGMITRELDPKNVYKFLNGICLSKKKRSPLSFLTDLNGEENK